MVKNDWCDIAMSNYDAGEDRVTIAVTRYSTSKVIAEFSFIPAGVEKNSRGVERFIVSKLKVSQFKKAPLISSPERLARFVSAKIYEEFTQDDETIADVFNRVAAIAVDL